MDFVAMMVGGLLGAGHCVGMCGPFVVTIGASSKRLSNAVLRQIAYGAGRMFTYAFLGALAGLAGERFASLDLPILGAQQVLAIAAGVLMVVVGFSHLGWVPWPRWLTGASTCSGLGSTLLGHFLHRPGYVGAFFAGVFTGFLPCGLLYTFLLLAMRTGHPLLGCAGMACFGLGTIPVLAAMGCGTAALSRAARIQVMRTAAMFVILLGAATVYRGWPRTQRCAHCPPQAEISEGMARPERTIPSDKDASAANAGPIGESRRDAGRVKQ